MQPQNVLHRPCVSRDRADHSKNPKSHFQGPYLAMDKRHVANKAGLVEPIVRHRVQDSLFYKQYLHLTNEQTLLPVIVEHVHYVGGTDASTRPSPFLCCLVRMLEIEPDLEIIQIYLRQNGHREFKYLTALTVLYCRMVMSASEFYAVHDEFIRDYRKLRFRPKNPVVIDGDVVHYTIRHMDEWVDEVATADRVVDVKTPFMNHRSVYVARGEVDERGYGDGTGRDGFSGEDEPVDDEYGSDSD